MALGVYILATHDCIDQLDTFLSYWPEARNQDPWVNHFLEVTRANQPFPRVAAKVIDHITATIIEEHEEVTRLVKLVYTTLKSEDAFTFYAKYLFPVFRSEPKGSFSRFVFLATLGHLIRKLKPYNANSHTVGQLKDKLIGVLQDTGFETFSETEVAAAASSLKKAKVTCQELDAWEKRQTAQPQPTPLN